MEQVVPDRVYSIRRERIAPATVRESAMTIDKITVARYIASRKAPYLTSALFRAPLVPTTSVPVAAMDEHGRMYYNPKELEEWQPEHVATVMLHEIFHWLNEHFARAGTRDLRRWNIATDMEIANMLRALDCRLDMPKPHITPESYNLPRDLLAEEYYDLLEQEKNNTSNSASGGNNSANGEENDDGGNDNNSGDSNASGASHPSGSASDGQPKPWELPSTDTQHPGLTETEQELLRREVAHAAEQHYKQRGDIPAAMKRLIDGMHRPHQVDWRTVLRRLVKSLVITTGSGDHYTYKRPNRRRNGTPFIFPSQQRIRPNVAVIVDTSGSMTSEELNAALAEIDALLQAVRSEITVLSVDAAVHTAQKIRHSKTVALVGGGGTDMMVGIRSAAQLSPCPNIVIVITDGYTDWSTTAPKDTPPVVAVLTCADSPQPPQWIHTVRIRTV